MRRASDRLHVWRTDQGSDQRLCDFAFQEQWTPGPLHIDDDLGIGNIRNGIQWGSSDGIHAEQDARRYQDQNNDPEANDILNDGADAHSLPDSLRWILIYIRNQ